MKAWHAALPRLTSVGAMIGWSLEVKPPIEKESCEMMSDDVEMNEKMDWKVLETLKPKLY